MIEGLLPLENLPSQSSDMTWWSLTGSFSFSQSLAKCKYPKDNGSKPLPAVIDYCCLEAGIWFVCLINSKRREEIAEWSPRSLVRRETSKTAGPEQ